MVIVLALVVSAVSLILLVVYLAHRRHADLRDHAILVQQLPRFPLAAFQNLAEPAELEYLRSRLPAKSFARCRRMRTLAMIAYVKLILRNTSVILRCAGMAVTSSDCDVSAQAQELMEVALQTRLNAFKALGLLYAGLLVPSISCDLLATLRNYNAAYGRSSGLSARILHS